MDEPLAVALKFGFLAVLYLFLLWVVRSSMRDLARYRARGSRRAGGGAEPEAPGARPPPSGATAASPRLHRGGRHGARAGHDLRRRRRRDVRAADNADIRVEDPFASSVARAHLQPRRRAMYLEDMGSTNGTYLNGRKVKSAERLDDGRHDPHRRQRIPLRGVVGRWRSASSSRPAARTSAASAPRTRTRSPCARRCSRWRTAWVARRPARWPRRVAVEAVEGAARVGRVRRGAAREHRPRGQPAHLRPRGGGRVATRDGHHAHAGEGARRRGEPRPRGRQPRLPHARRRARAAHARPLACRRARAERPDHAEAAEHHPQRSIITRALGPEPDVEVDTYTLAGRDGDVVPDLLGRAHLDDLGRRGRVDPALRGVPRRGRGGARPGGEPERRQGQHHGDPVPAGRGRGGRGARTRSAPAPADDETIAGAITPTMSRRRRRVARTPAPRRDRHPPPPGAASSPPSRARPGRGARRRRRRGRAWLRVALA